MIKADLHLHTTYSDGDFTPGEVVSKAASLGYSQISITDHDTIAGVEEAIASGRELGVSVVPGIEVTLRFVREYFVGSLHLLVYFPVSLLASSAFKADLTGVVSQGRGLSLVETRVERINEEFGPSGRTPLLVSPLEVSSVTSLASNVSRRHFAQALSSVHGLSSSQVTSLIGNASPAYVPSGVDLSCLYRCLPLIPWFPFWPIPLPVHFQAQATTKKSCRIFPQWSAFFQSFFQPGSGVLRFIIQAILLLISLLSFRLQFPWGLLQQEGLTATTNPLGP